MSIVWGPDPVDTYCITPASDCCAVRVWTANTLYEIEVTEPSTQQAVIVGGQYFDEPRVARVAGARLSMSEISLGSIQVGCRLELHIENQAIVTSPVRRIEIQSGAATPMSSSNPVQEPAKRQ